MVTTPFLDSFDHPAIILVSIRNVLREKNGIMWEKFPADPPQFGKPLLSKKKVVFIFHFRTSGTFLVFTKKSPFWVID